jgi:hypothetical protein
MMRTLPANILPNKSQPFSIVWPDDTDSICDLHCVLTYLDNHAGNRHRTNATRPFPMASRSAGRASNGAAAPSSPRSSSSLPQPPLSPRNAPAAAPAPSADIFAGIPSHQGTSSIASQGQDLSLSSANCSTRSVFLSSATFA